MKRQTTRRTLNGYFRDDIVKKDIINQSKFCLWTANIHFCNDIPLFYPAVPIRLITYCVDTTSVCEDATYQGSCGRTDKFDKFA